MKYLIAQFVPIILLFLFLVKNKEFLQFSKNVLGKLVAICLIIFYVSIDKFVGLFVCAIIIFFYQSSYIEGMDIMDIVELDQVEIEPANSEDIMVDDGTYVFLEEQKKTKQIKASNVSVIDKKKLNLVEPTSGSNEEDFRKNNCDKSVLKFKNMNVKNEMAEFVFPEMKFANEICNPCSKSCELSLQ
jgi:hypothetical protein